MKRITVVVILAAVLGTGAAALAADPCACGARQCSSAPKAAPASGLSPAELRP